MPKIEKSLTKNNSHQFLNFTDFALYHMKVSTRITHKIVWKLSEDKSRKLIFTLVRIHNNFQVTVEIIVWIACILSIIKSLIYQPDRIVLKITYNKFQRTIWEKIHNRIWSMLNPLVSFQKSLSKITCFRNWNCKTQYSYSIALWSSDSNHSILD